MRRFRRFLTFVFLTVAVASLLVGEGAFSPVVAAPPTPSSSLIDGFVLEVDDVYGYEMLRPASWKPVDLGGRRAYLLPSSANQPNNRITLAVTNLKVISDAFVEKNGMIATYEVFRQDPSLSPWMDKVEKLWDSNGIRYKSVRELTSARIYVVKPDSEQTMLVAFVISQGQPLGATMYGFDNFNDVRQLERMGILADFEVMVSSVSAHRGNPVQQELESTKSETIALPTDLGPYHSDSGYRQVGAFTYRLQTDYYQAPPRVYWLYEYMYYSGYQDHVMWLYRTHVTDNPQWACQGGFSLIVHDIGKHTTTTNGTVTDYPNRVVNHLNPSTAHMMVFGDPLSIICQWHYPF